MRRWHIFHIPLNKEMWEDLLKRMTTNNVTIDEGPVSRWGAHGAGTSIYFRDQEENRIEARYCEAPNGSE